LRFDDFPKDFDFVAGNLGRWQSGKERKFVFFSAVELAHRHVYKERKISL
jgi:hypothetical protein